MPGLKVCIVSNRHHPPHFVSSLAMLMVSVGRDTERFPKLGLSLQPMVSCLPQGRQNAVNFSLMEGFSHVLWLDDDMTFPRDAAHRLLAHDKPFIGVNYPRKTLPATWTAKNLEGQEFSSKGKTGIEEVMRIGFGVALMRTDLINRIAPPHFGIEWAGNGNYISDDVYFCRKLQTIGIRPWVDHDLSNQIGHIGDYVYTGAA